MNFDLPEGTEAILQSVREFCTREVAPQARRWDEAAEHPPTLFDRIAELGLLGILIPLDDGGVGLDAAALASTLEVIARADGATAFALATHAGAPAAVLASRIRGSSRGELLAALAAGTVRVTHGFGAMSAGPAPFASLVEGSWCVRGEVASVPAASTSTHLLLLADTAQGPTAFLLPAHAVTWGARVETLGLRACVHRDAALLDVTVGDDARVGEVGSGEAVRAEGAAIHDLCLAAISVGLGEGALSAATQYAKDRRQFGKAIAELQAIQWMLADSRAELDAGAALLGQATLAPEPTASAMARRVACAAATRACHRALQVHGGYGYTREYPVERCLRDARTCELEDESEGLTATVLSRGKSSAAFATGW
ncbi:MAG: acyl-CoA dehydrogenase family protein [Polyangiales bacterium]